MNKKIPIKTFVCPHDNDTDSASIADVEGIPIDSYSRSIVHLGRDTFRSDTILIKNRFRYNEETGKVEFQASTGTKYDPIVEFAPQEAVTILAEAAYGPYKIHTHEQIVLARKQYDILLQKSLMAENKMFIDWKTPCFVAIYEEDRSLLATGNSLLLTRRDQHAPVSATVGGVVAPMVTYENRVKECHVYFGGYRLRYQSMIIDAPAPKEKKKDATIAVPMSNQVLKFSSYMGDFDFKKLPLSEQFQKALNEYNKESKESVLAYRKSRIALIPFVGQKPLSQRMNIKL